MNKILQSSRYITLIAVIAVLLTGVAAMLWGAAKTVATIWLVVSTLGKDPSITIALIEVVDAFLIASAFYIFAVSLYVLFIGELDLPEWIQARNLDDLKGKLSSVIVLVMAVKFLEKLVSAKDMMEVLWMSISVTLMIGALIAFSYFGAKKH